MKLTIRESVSITSNTELNNVLLLFNKELIPSGLNRHVCLIGNNIDIWEFDKTKDYMQTATALTGSLTNALDYDDTTYDEVAVAASTTETTLAVYDLGVLDWFYIRVKLGKDDIATLNMYVYVSEDNVNWTEIACCTSDIVCLKYCRYVKVTYLDSGTTGGNVYCYTLEAYRKNENYALAHGITDSITKQLDYIIQTTDEKIMVILDNNGNTGYYSVVDEGFTNPVYKLIESEE